MTTATLSTKGQLVIPSRYRRALNLQAGDRVAIHMEGLKLVIEHGLRHRARLVERRGHKVLLAAPGAPPMTPESIKSILADER